MTTHALFMPSPDDVKEWSAGTGRLVERHEITNDFVLKVCKLIKSSKLKPFGESVRRILLALSGLNDIDSAAVLSTRIGHLTKKKRNCSLKGDNLFTLLKDTDSKKVQCIVKWRESKRRSTNWKKN